MTRQTPRTLSRFDVLRVMIQTVPQPGKCFSFSPKAGFGFPLPALRVTSPLSLPAFYNVESSITCGVSSLAITDAQPQLNDGSLREMKICPLYFTASVTQNNLASKKYDGDKRGSWCQTGQRFSDFETGGHTLLHEMTHLDGLCAAAGLPTRK